MNRSQSDPSRMIIVGIDFSPTASVAVFEARVLSERLATGFMVVHVSDGVRPGMWVPEADERAWLHASDLDEDAVTVRRGTPWVELVRVAAEKSADLIVVGTHGRTGFQPVALGTTAARLALLSPRPIVLVGTRDRLPERRNGRRPEPGLHVIDRSRGGVGRPPRTL